MAKPLLLGKICFEWKFLLSRRCGIGGAWDICRPLIGWNPGWNSQSCCVFLAIATTRQFSSPGFHNGFSAFMYYKSILVKILQRNMHVYKPVKYICLLTCEIYLLETDQSQQLYVRVSEVSYCNENFLVSFTMTFLKIIWCVRTGRAC